MSILVLGCSNLDRQDDGVAWHVLACLVKDYGFPNPETIDTDEYCEEKGIHFLYQLQLLPEIASELSNYDYAVFIDAHNGVVPNEVNLTVMDPVFQSSPLTHHLTVNSLLYIAQKLNGKYPKSILVSIRGYEFKFTQQLSPQTQELVPIAVNKIQDWIKSLPL